MVEKKQEGGVFCPPPPGKIGLNFFFYFVAPSCSVKTLSLILPVASARFKISRPQYYANWLSSRRKIGDRKDRSLFLNNML